jgi:chloride channel protein, CIC family
LMLCCVIADLIALNYLPHSIMTEKLARRGLHVPGEYEANVLNFVRVDEVMRKDAVPIPAEMTVGDLTARIGRGEHQYTLTEGLPIAAADGKLVGVVTQGDLLRALEDDPAGKTKVVNAGGHKPIVAFSDERAFDALFRMLQNNIGRLPVVTRADPERMVGYLNRSSILSVWSRQIEEEGVREHGWFDKILGTAKFAEAGRRKLAVGRVVSLRKDLLTLVSQDGEPNAPGETLEFHLLKPVPGIAAGDHVRVTYHSEAGSNTLLAIHELRVH